MTRALFLLMTLCACSTPPSTPSATPAAATTPTGPGDAQRGRLVYQGTCIACHNADPALPGSLGPEVKGASRALLEARVMRAEYPDGYTPKRATKIMQPMPQLADNLDDLAAYLAL